MLPRVVKLSVRHCRSPDGVAGTVLDEDGKTLKQHFSSNEDYLHYDLFTCPSAREFWAKEAPNGIRLMSRSGDTYFDPMNV